MPRLLIETNELWGSTRDKLNSMLGELYNSQPSLNNFEYEFVKSGNTGVNQSGNMKLTLDQASRLGIQRFDGETDDWADVAEVGNSITTDEIFLRPPFQSIFVFDHLMDREIHNALIRRTASIAGWIAGDVNYPGYLASNGDLQHWRNINNNELHHLTLNPVDTYEIDLTNDLYFDFANTAVAKVLDITFKVLNDIDHFRFTVYQGGYDGDLVYENISEYDYFDNTNTDSALTAGTVIMNIRKFPLYISNLEHSYVKVQARQNELIQEEDPGNPGTFITTNKPILLGSGSDTDPNIPKIPYIESSRIEGELDVVLTSRNYINYSGGLAWVTTRYDSSGDYLMKEKNDEWIVFKLSTDPLMVGRSTDPANSAIVDADSGWTNRGTINYETYA